MKGWLSLLFIAQVLSMKSDKEAFLQQYCIPSYQNSLLTNTADNAFNTLSPRLQKKYKKYLQKHNYNDLEGYQFVKKFTYKNTCITNISFLPANLLLIGINKVGSHESILELWDYQNNTFSARSEALKGHITKLATTPQGNYILVITRNKMAYYFKPNHYHYFALFKTFNKPTPINDGAFSPDNTQFCLAEDQVELFNNKSGELLQILPCAAQTVAYHPQLRLIATLNSSSHIVNFWDKETGELKKKIDINHAFEPRISFSPQDSLFSLLVPHGYVTLWNYETGKEEKNIIENAVASRVSSVAFSPDNKEFVYGEDDGRLTFNQLKKKSRRKKDIRLGCSIVDIRYASPLIMGCADNQAHILQKLPNLKEYLFDKKLSLGSQLLIHAVCSEVLKRKQACQINPESPFFKELDPELQNFLTKISSSPTPIDQAPLYNNC